MNKDKILVADVKYYPYGEPTKWAQSNFWWDEHKLNLLWLACPEIDEMSTAVWSGNEISSQIDDSLTHDVRALLNLPPIEFMQKFSKFPHNSKLTDGWLLSSLPVMWLRAKQANARLIHALGPNIYSFNFRAHRK